MKRRFKNRLKNPARKTPPAKQQLNPEHAVLSYATECVRGATLTDVLYRLLLESNVEWDHLVGLVKKDMESVYPERNKRERPDPDQLYTALKDELSPKAEKLVREWRNAAENKNCARAVDENAASFYLGVAWGRQLEAGLAGGKTR